MLFKYGPPGGKWDPTVLSGVSGAMLDWRAKQGAMRPVYDPMPFPGAPPAYYGDDMTALGNTVGMFTKAKNGISYSRAQQIDEQHKFNMAVLTTAGSLFGAVGAPEGITNKVVQLTVKKGLKYSQTLALLGRTVIAPNTSPFSTDNAANQQAINSKDAKDVESSFSPAVAQGLIRSGKAKMPVGRSWYDPKTQTVKPGAWNDKDFVSWFREDGVKDQSQSAMNDMDTGYQRFEGSDDGN